MTETEKQLEDETKKWLEKLKDEDIDSAAGKGEMFVENIEAYTKDAEHFLEEGDLVRAFEAVVWAWSWLEIGEELNGLKRR
ncbi:MAG: DUF357 domain-containing protein [Candidatus Aenigmatarchaeota archaeon]